MNQKTHRSRAARLPHADLWAEAQGETRWHHAVTGESCGRPHAYRCSTVGCMYASARVSCSVMCST